MDKGKAMPTDERSSPQADTRWWAEEAGFFGDFYLLGDNSTCGHLDAMHLSLEERTSREVEGVLRLLNFERRASILDMPCGYGRHSIGLALRGHDVVGADINERLLAMARKDAETQRARVTFIRENMLTLASERQYDAVVNMFYSFGFFETEEENAAVLKNFLRTLRPGGRLVMHTDVNVERVINGTYKMAESRPLVSGGVLHIQESFERSSRRIRGSWRIDRPDGSCVTRGYSVRVYEVEEFRRLCVESGFDSCVPYGDWLGGNCRPDSEELIFVATK
jgi:SAM-dependent methyltransferase